MISLAQCQPFDFWCSHFGPLLVTAPKSEKVNLLFLGPFCLATFAAKGCFGTMALCRDSRKSSTYGSSGVTFKAVLGLVWGGFEIFDDMMDNRGVRKIGK